MTSEDGEKTKEPLVYVQLELRTVHLIKDSLLDAANNAEELLRTHEESLGRSTKKNKLIAEMYELEISTSRHLAALLKKSQPHSWDTLDKGKNNE